MRIVIALVVVATIAILLLVALEFDKVADVNGTPETAVETVDTGDDTAASDGDVAVDEQESAGGADQAQEQESAGAEDETAAAVDTADETAGTGTADAATSADAGGTSETDEAGAQAETGEVAPSFDVVRVERTGDAVMAGRAAPFAIVEIYDQDGVVASTQADEKGNWVIVLEEPLEPGSHELWLQSSSEEGGASVASEETVVMLVPEQDEAGGSASVTVTQNEQQSTGGEAASDGETAIAVLLPKDDEAHVQILQEPEEGVGIAGGDGLSLHTLDYDQTGDVTLSGKAEPGAEVRAYVDGELAGRALADESGAWQMELDQPVELGLHSLRVDQVDDQGQVLSRLETPFDRESLQFPASAEPLVIIQPGNNLWTIARHTYGSGFHYTQIFKANQGQIANPDLIYPGQIFVLPELDQSGT